ncbi:hypothetical protein ASPFODRAFT_459910 [Aspergillus luchuensis CBS 106.47]|uniref:Uncharacterized protein n=1 Tax=Aspergillus luchuensis (strain CBS 106.47) TaxID=1137211 RepID=A0A1M3T0Q7_ASPLC|nr:hypothetical protein ASPFODRAFT_459910 [Aspergillus luchuensis CBS 106.47]
MQLPHWVVLQGRDYAPERATIILVPLQRTAERGCWWKVSKSGGPVRTMDFYLLVVSGVSTLALRGREAKRIQVVRVGRAAEFPWYPSPPNPRKSEEKGYENHPTTVYSIFVTRDRNCTCFSSGRGVA